MIIKKPGLAQSGLFLFLPGPESVMAPSQGKRQERLAGAYETINCLSREA
jgi:hypothetical protein